MNNEQEMSLVVFPSPTRVNVRTQEISLTVLTVVRGDVGLGMVSEFFVSDGEQLRVKKVDNLPLPLF